jgi:putative hemolysin
MMNKKISTLLAFCVIIILAVLVAGISFYLWKGVNFKNNPVVNFPKKNNPVACTMEAKLCPDGSFVSRVAPDCDFTPCPEFVGIGSQIIINSLKPNDVVVSPLSITGKAVGGWFSEGSFPVGIHDSNDKLLGSSTAQFVPKSDTDTWMTNNFVDFKADLKFDAPKTDNGYILFKKDNPSGKPENDESYKLPVKFNGGNSGIANPASVFCEQNGGKLEIITAADGSQSGMCQFSDGSECEEWKFMRGECKLDKK